MQNLSLSSYLGKKKLSLHISVSLDLTSLLTETDCARNSRQTEDEAIIMKSWNLHLYSGYLCMFSFINIF